MLKAESFFFKIKRKTGMFVIIFFYCDVFNIAQEALAHAIKRKVKELKGRNKKLVFCK